MREVVLQHVLQGMMNRHLVLLAALLMQPNAGPVPLEEVVTELHLNRYADACEGVNLSPMSARSRPPMSVSCSIESSSCRVLSASSTGVLPRFTECYGPRTELAGFWALEAVPVGGAYQNLL